jgi:hypothetical protein
MGPSCIQKHSVSRPEITHTLNYHQLQLAGCDTYKTMPRTFQLTNIRHTTTIILVDSTLIQGDLRHIDQSTTITNRDAFNIELESSVTQQPLPSTASLGKVIKASRALKYNGYIQRQPPWHLQIPPPRVVNTIQTELQVLHVSGKF